MASRWDVSSSRGCEQQQRVRRCSCDGAELARWHVPMNMPHAGHFLPILAMSALVAGSSAAVATAHLSSPGLERVTSERSQAGPVKQGKPSRASQAGPAKQGK